MKLNAIKDNKGATHKTKRIGRGIGSGMGKTSTRGHKGQKSRTGVALKAFEGGQQPIYRRLPKRGFCNIFRVSYQSVNVGMIQKAVDDGRLDAKVEITPELLVASGLLRKGGQKAKLLATGKLTASVKISVHAASESAQKIVSKAGGAVTILAAEVNAEAESDAKAKVKAPKAKKPAAKKE